MSDVFVSYSRRDEEFVRRLAQALADRGKDVWVDWEDIPKTADWWARIRAGIEEANAFAFVISPHALGSEVCRDEVEHATESGKRFVPLLLRAVDGTPLPPAVSAHNWIDFSHPDDFDARVEELVQALETDFEWTERHTAWLVRANEWERSGRDSSRLLRGAELTAAETWLAGAKGKDPAPTQLHVDHVLASRKQSTRRARAATAAVSFALVVAVALSILALVQRGRAIDQRELASARELVANSSLNLGDDPELSVALAARAVRMRVTPETEGALRRAIVRSTVRHTLAGTEGADAALLSPDGTHVAVSAAAGTTVKTTVREVRSGRTVLDVRPATRYRGVQFAPDGRRLLTEHDDGRVRLWTLGQPRPIVLGASGARLTAAAWSGDAAVVTGDERGRLRLWDAARGDELGRLRTGRPISSVAVADRYVAVGDERGGAAVWDLASRGRRLARRQLPLKLGASVLLSENGRTLVAQAGEIAQVYDVRTGRRLLSEPALSVALAPGGDFVAYGARNLAAVIVRLSDGKPFEVDGHRGDVIALAFDPSGGTLATADADGRTLLSRTADATSAGELPDQDGGVTGVSFDAAGRLATAATEAPARVWQPTLSGRVLAPLAAAGAPDPAPPEGVLVRDTGGAPLLVRARDGRSADPDGENSGVIRGLIAADAGRALALTRDGALRLQDVASGRAVAESPARAGGEPGALLVAGDGSAAMAAWEDDAVLLTREERRSAKVPGVPRALAGAKRAVVTGEGEALVIALPEGRTVARWPLPAHEGVDATAGFAREAERVAVGSGDVVEVRDSTDGRLVRTLRTRAFGTVAVSLSDDGRRLAAAGRNAVVVHDVGSGRVVARFNAPDELTGASISGDGELVTAVDADGRVHAWHATSGQEVLTVTGETGAVTARRGAVRTISGDAVYEWPCDGCLPLDALLRLADDRVTRRLTPAERSRYLHE